MSISTVQNQSNTFYSPSVPSSPKAVVETNNESNTNETKQTDRVYMSDEAITAQRQEQYKLKDATDLFYEWQNMNIDSPVIFLPSTIPENDDNLLPENKSIIEQLQTKLKNSTSAYERTLTQGQIDLVRSLGDKEIFNSLSDVDKRQRAVGESFYLQRKYLAEKYGISTIEEIVKRQQINSGTDMIEMSSPFPSLSDLTGKSFPSDPPPKVSALFEPKGYSLDQFNNKDFLFNLLAEHKTVMDRVRSNEWRPPGI